MSRYADAVQAEKWAEAAENRAAGISARSLARCPLCDSRLPMVGIRGRAHYVQHCTRIGRGAPTCEASGWLVEDDEVVR